jgi:predicted regulator of Ras-like GTPase activity (Roadblock/LC7/MglB family)
VQLGCGAVEHAVLTADKGAVVCERLADEAGGGLVLIATTDKRAAGLIHIEARRHTELLARLSAELWPDEHGPESWPRGEPAHGCEVAWPNGHPYDAIGGQLAAYNVKAIALLRFASGARWMLASSVPLEEAALVGGACYNPSELVDLPASLRLGPVRSALVLTQSNIITINAPSGGGVGLVCVFPNRYREGLLRMKAEKASALLCQV